MQTNKLPLSKNVEMANPVVNRGRKTGREDKRYKEDPNEVAERIRTNASISTAYRDAIKGKSDKEPSSYSDMRNEVERAYKELQKRKKPK